MSKSNEATRFSAYSAEDLKEVSRKGGIASGQARQARKQLREELTALLSNGDVQQRLCTALIDKALSGDSKAFSIIRDTIGEKPVKDLQIFTGDSMEGFRDRYAMEIEQLYIDELNRDENRLYGDMARNLIGLEQSKQVVERLMSASSGDKAEG